MIRLRYQLFVNTEKIWRRDGRLAREEKQIGSTIRCPTNTVIVEVGAWTVKRVSVYRGGVHPV